jgi:hypothetical protein
MSGPCSPVCFCCLLCKVVFLPSVGFPLLYPCSEGAFLTLHHWPIAGFCIETPVFANTGTINHCVLRGGFFCIGVYRLIYWRGCIWARVCCLVTSLSVKRLKCSNISHGGLLCGSGLLWG